MAKKKKRKSLLPKRIAGVKVPKAVRKGRFGELLASQTGRALLAEALLAAGAIGGAKKAGDAVVDKAADAPSLRSFATGVGGRLKDGSAKDAGASGAALAVAIGEAARAFVTAMNAHGEPPEAAVETEWTAQEDGGGSKKKPRSSPPPSPAGG